MNVCSLAYEHNIVQCSILVYVRVRTFVQVQNHIYRPSRRLGRCASCAHDSSSIIRTYVRVVYIHM